MDTSVNRNINRLRDVRNGALAVAGIALACLMDGMLPGTSEHIVHTLEYVAVGGGAVAVGAELLAQHSEPSHDN